MKVSVILSLLFCLSLSAADRPNILFCFSDDWGRYASIYKDPKRPGLNDVINTPVLDQIGRSGVVFNNAFVSAPSCTPCRASVTTGMPFYRCGSKAFLHSYEYGKAKDPFKDLPGFSEILVKNGYHVMHWGKTTHKPAGRKDNKNGGPIHHFSQTVSEAKDIEAEKEKIFGYVRENFKRFLSTKKKDQPFFYWFGPHNSHRQWTRGSGKKIWGLDPDSLKGKIPAFLPDVHDVREDIADYLGEALAWDSMLNELLEELKERNELDNTLIIVSGDHGMPGMPRGKCNLHDFGSMVSLLVSWPKQIPAKRKVDDFISLMDIAPTVLEAAGIKVPEHMLAKSFLDISKSDKNGWIDSSRDHVIIGRERHVGGARADRTSYPSRAIRTKDFLLVRNFRPERMPMGDQFTKPTEELLLTNHRAIFPDMDASPTKAFVILNKESHKKYYDIAVSPRPEYELYDLRKDPDQVNNVAANSEYKEVLEKLGKRMMDILNATKDPRVIGDGMTFEKKPFVNPSFVDPPRKKKKK